MTQVLHTINTIESKFGGPSRSVPQLCVALASIDNVNVELATRVGRSDNEDTDSSLVRHNASTTSSKFASKAWRQMLSQIVSSTDYDILHDHGIWLTSNRVVCAVAQANQLMRVVSPRGMVSRWALSNGRIKKAIAWALYQKRDLRSAHAFHATSAMEADEIRRLGLSQPIAIIPNGVDAPEQITISKTNSKEMLFLSRIHPKKGIENLLRAWQKTLLGSDWRLKIVGPSEPDYLSKLQDEANRLQVSDSIEFLGPVDDSKKWECYSQASVFVLPSHSENFGIVVAEAMAAGLPVLTTSGTPWDVIGEKNFGWFVEPTVDGIAPALLQIRDCPASTLSEIGHRAAEWANQEFAWNAIGEDMYLFYRWLIGSASKPNFVV